jgi:Delta7-sterol 5-desaturase
MESWNISGVALGVVLATLLRYLLFAGLAWLLAYVWFRRRWWHRKIIRILPLSSDIQREIRHSLRTALIFGCVGALTVMAIRRGWTRMYFDWESHSMAWWWGSILLTIFLHDTWFYWTHRWMHQPRWFRIVHYDHHRSRNPTPWAAFAFSPFEALVQALIFPLTVLLFPIHPLAFGVFMIWQMGFNVIGHTGYEYNRSWFSKSWIRFFVNTPTNHIMHHESLKGNFGLYFNFWDRLMKTNHPEYDARLAQMTDSKP